MSTLDPIAIYNALPFGPSESFRYINLARKIIEIGLENDISTHINGHGGDELFGPLSTMAWSLYHSNYPNRIRNLYGFARLNKFNLFKYSSKWMSTLSVESFVTQTARDLITRCATSYAEKDIESYSDDKSIHKILEEIESHTLLQRDLNAMVPTDKYFRFLSPYTNYDIVESALKYNIDERFNAKVTKPMLAEIRPHLQNTVSVRRYYKKYFLKNV